MPKFRTKPVVIEAFQITAETEDDNGDWPSWLHEAWQKDRTRVGAFYRIFGSLYIRVRTGQVLLVSNGDWIIHDVNWEISLCKPGIFDATYEPVDG